MDMCAELATRQGVEVKLVYINNLAEYDISEAKYDLQCIPSAVQLSLTKAATYNIAALEALIKTWQPDVIHSHLFEAEIVSRSVTYPQAKWFSHCHDNMHQLETLSLATLGSKKRITEYYERTYLLKRYRANGGNKFIAISKDAQQYFERVLPKDLNHVTHIPNAINSKRFTKPDGYTKQVSNLLQLVTVGSLVDKKNQALLIDVVEEMVKHGTDVHLHILGDGPNRQKLQGKVDALKLWNHVTLHGNVAKVEEYLWNSDIYVHGAYYEPFGLVLVEAMAAGLPVVSLDGRGNRDIISNSENGYILPKQDAKVFADHILQLADDKALYTRIQQAGLQTAKRFDIVNYVDMLLQLYKS
jgi:glycosyltransferase involved in cell wall biosynthesis